MSGLKNASSQQATFVQPFLSISEKLAPVSDEKFMSEGISILVLMNERQETSCKLINELRVHYLCLSV